MKTAWKRTGAVLVSWLLLCLLALSASAVGPVEVGVAFWKDSKGEQTSLANDGIDTDRAATLTRQANGTYTLELPLKKLSRINIPAQEPHFLFSMSKVQQFCETLPKQIDFFA